MAELRDWRVKAVVDSNDAHAAKAAYEAIQ